MIEEWENVHFHYPDIPTMISDEERKYLFWVASKIWTGTGTVVEIGPWLGGSTYCLAAGMSQNSTVSDKKLCVYDNFIWREFMAERAALPIKPGDSFQEFFRSNVKEFSFIEDRRRSLPDEQIISDTYLMERRQANNESFDLIKNDNQERTEIFFIDGAKSWTGMKYLIQQFYGSFIPNESLIICQDYKYWGTYWVVIILELLIEDLSVEHNLLNSNTVTFRFTPGSIVKEVDICEFEDTKVEEGLGLIDKASNRLLTIGDQLGYLILQLSKVRFLYHKDRVDDSLQLFKRIEASWPYGVNNNSLEQARIWLEKQLQNNIPPHLKTILRRKSAKAARLLKRYFIKPLYVVRSDP